LLYHSYDFLYRGEPDQALTEVDRVPRPVFLYF